MLFAFRPNRAVVPILGAFLCFTPILQAVHLEMGRTGEVLLHEVETPNLQSGGKAELPWASSTPAIAIPKVEKGVYPPISPVLSELIARFQDLIGPFAIATASDSKKVLPLKSVLTAPGTFVHTGVGNSEKVAVSDGTAVIEVFLPTYNPASVMVRIINPDNTEQVFFGESLLTWERPDDKAKALVRFKGEEQPNSMYLNGTGDWSANPQKYTVALKAGQRVILSISGNPLPSSFLRVSSDAF
ncbi:MAG: hypothetical protein WA705_22440 [Candidatus Ozemobacteraceae bacterium]